MTRYLFALLLSLSFAPHVSFAQTAGGWESGASVGAAPLSGQASANGELIPYDVRVYPVPARSSLNVEFLAPESGRLVMQWMDLMGRALTPVREIEVQEAGLHTQLIEFQQLSSGAYLLRLVYQSAAGGRPLIVHRRVVLE